MKRHRRQVTLTASCAFLALGAWLIGACGPGSTCDQAVDKLHSCGLEDAALTPAGEECAPFAACAAACVLKGSCNDLSETFVGSSGGGDGGSGGAIQGDCSSGNEVDQCICDCGE